MKSIKVSWKSKTITDMKSYLIKHYHHDNKLAEGYKPMFAVVVNGFIRWLNEDHVEIVPEIKLV